MPAMTCARHRGGGGLSLRLAAFAALFACAAPAAYADGITVLNQQSYPEVGGLWTVRFATQGTHDLSISGTEGTAVGEQGDVSFAWLRDAGGRDAVPAREGDSMVFAGYGGGASELAVRVNTPGPHALLLQFGGSEAVARNYAYPRQATEITAVGPQLSANDEFGTSAALIGDVDGDGVPDLAVGAGGDDEGGSSAGAVYLIFLNADGTAKKTFEINASSANGPQLASGDLFGTSLASVGDLDGDGVPDLAAGASSDDEGASHAGAVHIMYLNSDGTIKRTAEINASSANGPQLSANDEFGSSLAAVGDLDGDGVPDLAAGATRDNAGAPGAGAVHLLYLNSDGTVKRTAEINASSANGPQLAGSDFFGSSLAAVGDLDGDGVPDLAAGARGDDEGGRNVGAVHLLYLNSDGTVKRTAEINASSANGPQLAAFDRFGASLASGDLDGDGVPDLAAGAPGAGAGAVHLLYLNSDGTVKRTAEINASSANGPQLSANDEFGASLASGDLDGDGVPDLAAGATGDDEGASNAGAAHVLFLNANGTLKRTAETNALSAREPRLETSDGFGSSLAAIGDLDRDGVPDLAAGAPGDDEGGSRAGAVHLLLMTSTGTEKRAYEINARTADGPRLRAGDEFGSSLAAIGDLDRDGVADLAAGAPGDDEGGSRAGAVHLLLLTSTGTVKRTIEINASTANGPSLAGGDAFGSSLAAVGDLDYDGVPDLAAGAPGDDGGAAGAGAVHVLYLNSDGTVKRTAEINASTPNGPSLAGGDAFGSSLSMIGDPDRDGAADLAAGAPGDDGGAPDAGAVHLLYLNSDGTAKRTAEINASTPNGPSLAGGDAFGSSLAAIGDLDRDGVPDLAAGAPGGDGGAADAGAVHLLLLASAGTVKQAIEIDASTPNGPSLAGGDAFGSSLAAIGDLDRDGAADLAAGAPGDDAGAPDAGAVHVVRLGVRAPLWNGTLASFATLDNSGGARADAFGLSVASLGDMDRDGIADVAVGVPGDDEGASSAGAVRLLYLNSDGTVKSTAEIDASTANGPQLGLADALGSSVALVGDVDGDGTADIAAGASGFSIRIGQSEMSSTVTGEVHLFLMTSTGTVKRTVEIDSSIENGPVLAVGDGFGSSLAAVGDLDRDGVPDLAAGADRATRGYPLSGAVHILYLNPDGTVKRTAEINSSTANGPQLTSGDFFGSSIAPLGDLDRDGVADLAVGALGDDDGDLTSSGAVHILYLNSDGTVKRTAEINPSTPNAPSLGDQAQFGTSLGAAGDMDRDGVEDMLVGAPGAGSAYVLLLNPDGSVKGAHIADGTTVAGLGLGADSTFGDAVAALADIDGDGAAEIAVGAPFHERTGAVHVMSEIRPAFVERVGSGTPDGQYSQGSVIDIEVEFSEPVNVTGTPALLLETGATDRQAGYVSGSGTDKLAFSYVVQYGDFSPDLGYVSESSFLLLGGTVGASSKTTAHGLPVPGAPLSLSFSKALQIDAVRPVLEGTPLLDLATGILRLDFDKQMDASEISAGGVAVAGRNTLTSLAGAAGPSSDTDTTVLKLTGEQTNRLVLAYLRDGPLTLDISGRAFEDVLGNRFAGVSGAQLQVRIGLGQDEPAIADSHRAYKSGYPRSDSPAVSDSASAYNKTLASLSATAAVSDSARAYKSGSASSSSPALSDSASSVDMKVAASSDTASFSDSARAYLSSATLSDSPAFSDSASRAGMRVAASSDTASFSDSARAYLSSATLSDSPAFSDSASRAGMRVAASSDTASFSDSARAYLSSATLSDSPAFSDSASRAGMRVAASSDTASFSDSARAYLSSATLSDSPAFSDSASRAGMRVAASSDTASFSDSARAFKSGSVQSSSPALSDFASRADMKVRVSVDTSTLSDSARAFKSGSVQSSSPVLSDSASFAGMLVASSSDTADVSDSARAFKSGSVQSSSPSLSDSASRTGMKLAASSDTAVFTDSARSYRSGIAVSDSPAPSSSASYSGLFVQGQVDRAQFSDSARALRSGIVQSSSPTLYDSASRSEMRVSASSDSSVFTDSARAYKSVFGASGLLAPSDSARWQSARAAFDSDSPVLADSATARLSSAAKSDSPALSDSARAGASARLLSDSPALRDGAATGLPRPPVIAADAPSVSDGARHAASGPAPDDAAPARVSVGGGGPARGTGGSGIATAVIHAVSYERCSDEPRAEVTASPSERTIVTLEQAGARTVAHPSEQRAGAPDSAVWTAPILPGERSLLVRAVHQSTQGVVDSRQLDLDSCSGSVRFTAFGQAPAAPAPPPAVRPLPEEPPAERPPPEEDRAEPARPEAGAGPETPQAEAEPPESGHTPAAAQPEPEARPPPAPDLTREPAAEPGIESSQAPAVQALEPWHAAAAAAGAAGILLAVMLARRR